MPAHNPAAPSTIIFIHRSAMTIAGETAVFDDIGMSGLRVLRRYCPRCGSPLTTEPDLTPDLMMVKAETLDSNEWFRPVWELFVGPRPWGRYPVIPVSFGGCHRCRSPTGHAPVAPCRRVGGGRPADLSRRNSRFG